MKTLSTLIVLGLSILFTNAQETGNSKTITVTIENITNNNGHVLLALHTENTFMKGNGIQTQESKIIDGKITVTFENVKVGSYAIMALHDENDNKTMDFSESGMPKESYGMSNNPAGFGPPQFATAKFDLKEDLDLKIIF
ncbi:MAG: DUF2141 domain-containing protein [Flaviramulus sp.]|nr:DUF2141 domain-containing protein [Flaviramulus sp.]